MIGQRLSRDRQDRSYAILSRLPLLTKHEEHLLFTRHFSPFPRLTWSFSYSMCQFHRVFSSPMFPQFHRVFSSPVFPLRLVFAMFMATSRLVLLILFAFCLSAVFYISKPLPRKVDGTSVTVRGLDTQDVFNRTLGVCSMMLWSNKNDFAKKALPSVREDLRDQPPRANRPS
jgi:hypothetical protein